MSAGNSSAQPVLVGKGLGWHQMPAGSTFRSVERTITEADLVNFIGNTGMLEVIFMRAGKEDSSGEIRGRLVPAALVYSFAEGLLIPMVQTMGIAFLGMDLQVKGPTFVGDTIHVDVEVVESRPSKNRPGDGLVRTRNSVIRQDGSVSIVYTPTRLLKGPTGA